MQRELDLGDTVYALCTEHPDLVPVLRELGFTDIAKPGMLQTAGRFMTLKKGAAMKNVEIARIRAALEANGYTVRE
ncbi:MAG TPA: DUF1858 domain-containing protein [Feifaniaceae bacterium]|nr:DUF1858 domain-containing protein [Feifaniaceae bacterium]